MGDKNIFEFTFNNHFNNGSDYFITVAVKQVIDEKPVAIDIRRDFICFSSDNSNEVIGDIDLSLSGRKLSI